jgi:tRNA(fMet)-specific endonuclease VapC
VVDTSVASFMLDDRPELERYEAELAVVSTVYVSFQTVAELRFGALNRQWGRVRIQALETFIERLEIVGYTDELSTKWARVAYEARRAGRRLEAGDAWIAATALLLGAPLVTHDRDFAGIASSSVEVVCHA